MSPTQARIGEEADVRGGRLGIDLDDRRLGDRYDEPVTVSSSIR